MNERDLTRLHDMLEYAREAIQFVEGKTLDALDDDLILTRALTYSIGVIGEAATNISREFQDANPQIAWAEIVGMRNRLFHGYLEIKRERLWATVTIAIPALIVELEKLIDINRDEDAE